MKPHRVKRVEPQGVGPGNSAGAVSAALVHFLRDESHDRVGGCSWRCEGFPARSRALGPYSALAAGVSMPPARGRSPRASQAPGRLRAFDSDVSRPKHVATARVDHDPALGRAEGRWRISRHSTRPVLKHGPRSLTCARVTGSYETQGRSEGEGAGCSAEVGRRASGAAAPPARPRGLVLGAAQERTRWDPKGGELYVSRTKSGETLMEVRSDSDVQIDRRTCV